MGTNREVDEVAVLRAKERVRQYLRSFWMIVITIVAYMILLFVWPDPRGLEWQIFAVLIGLAALMRLGAGIVSYRLKRDFYDTSTPEAREIINDLLEK